MHSEPTLARGQVPSETEEPLKRAVSYLRVSSTGQADKDYDPEGFSLPAQRRGCESKAETLDSMIVEEFLERGESAKSRTRRPALRAMLERVKRGDIDYVIVHKIDRLARNRMDDALIVQEIRAAGATLVSVSENVDETPGGMLLHGVIASISEFYSQNLSNEVKKGTREKARKGGTPFRAPLGYLNVPEYIDGRTIRTIAIDPERGPLITRAFKLYATETFTLSELAALLEAEGLRNRPPRTAVPQPVGVNRLAEILRSDYYVGVVRYSGKVSEGRHPHLIDRVTFEKVQAILDAHGQSGERNWKHHHYLRGTLRCGECGSRLYFTKAKGNGGVYEYFSCAGRQRGECSQPYHRGAAVEDAVEREYLKVQLTDEQRESIRTAIHERVRALEQASAPEISRANADIQRLAAQEKKLLRAHYDDEISPELFKSEQNRIQRERATAEHELALLKIDSREALEHLDEALALTDNVHAAYRVARPGIRRLLNQAIFEWIKIEREDVEEAGLAEPFATLLSDELAPVRSGKKSPQKLKTPASLAHCGGSEDRLILPFPSVTTYREGSYVGSLVRLSGACSNQSQLAVVRKAVEARSKLTITEPTMSRPSIRPRLGEIQDAVLRVIQNHNALSPTATHALVEQHLGRPVSYDSIASFLSVASRNDKWPIERLRPGTYSWKR